MEIDSFDRDTGCPCCESRSLRQRYGVISSFLARRALLQPPQPVVRLICTTCGHSWSRRGLSDAEAQRLYAGYRGEDYFKDRHRDEPWYSRAINDEIGHDHQMTQRRAVLADCLDRAERAFGARPVGRVLDHGGDRGQLLRDLPDPERLVFDLSGVGVDPWACAIDADDLFQGAGFDLILNCQVMEHVNDPGAVLRDLHRAAVRGGWVYVEVPNERWREISFAPPSANLAWLRFVCRHPTLLKALDFVSTACRVKLGFVPPLCFWVMREHVNFFTPLSLQSLLERNGFDVAFSEPSRSGISAVARKST